MVSLLGAIIPAPHTVTVEHALTDGPDGPRWGTAGDWPGRWEAHSEKLQTAEGRVIEIRARVYLPADSEPKPGDRLTYQGEQYWARKVDTPVWTDGTAMHHEVRVS